MKIAVIGGGSWGTALAWAAGRAGHGVQLWMRDAEAAETVNATRENSRYLPGLELPSGVGATAELAEAICGVNAIVLAVPSHAVRDVLRLIASCEAGFQFIVNTAKGIEAESCKRVSEVVRDELGEEWRERFVCLSGPSFAREVASGHPTAIVAASEYSVLAEVVQQLFSFDNLRVYTTTDLVGVELCGALKNVMALAAGMVTGLGFGDNTRAAMITRGLAEMVRFARARGARIETLAGLAGLGDLVLTCTGGLSRNRKVGEELGRGRSLPEALALAGGVAEGVRTSRAVKTIADCVRIEMPIVTEVDAVLSGVRCPLDAVAELMRRPLRDEPGSYYDEGE